MSLPGDIPDAVGAVSTRDAICAVGTASEGSGNGDGESRMSIVAMLTVLVVHELQAKLQCK
jgi:hypothetical protein